MDQSVQALGALVRLCRAAHAAAAVSVARVEGGELVYVAADGEGADAIVGTRLPLGQGLAGYVAASGQALEVAHVADDPRFARQVAESTGYLPDAILLAPAVDAEGEVVGVLSVLDRRRGDGDGHALELAGHAAEVAAGLLVRDGDGHRASVRSVVEARARALGPRDTSLATAVAEALDAHLSDDGPGA